MLHGGFGTANYVHENYNMTQVAEEDTFIVIYGQGVGLIPTWNGGGCCGVAESLNVDDVGYVETMLDYVLESIEYDTKRVYAAGHSNGGLLAYRLACELPHRIAAIGPVAGTLEVTNCSVSERVVPVFHIHGSDDAHVLWDGGLGCGVSEYPFSGVEYSLGVWREYGNCSSDSVVIFTQGNGVCSSFLGCRPGVEVVICRIEGGGHSWPGSSEVNGLCAADGVHSTTFHASRAFWNLAKHVSIP